MNVVDYFRDARKLAIYPQDSAFVYPSLGLGGEIGELCEKLGQYEMRFGVTIDDIAKEIGDVLWYVANTAIDANINIDDFLPECCSGIGDATFEKIQAEAPTIHPLIFAGRGGEACELAKKFIRDDDSVLSPARRFKVQQNLIAILFSLGAFCDQLGISLADAAQKNLDKLQSRKDRGVLQGSGDNR
jgi:NTP pyrophosphatase (non-canonical NTP hydrolase)